MKRDLIAVIWSLLVTGAISKWAFHVAYLERGYKAVGGEYLVILVAYVAAWKAINYARRIRPGRSASSTSWIRHESSRVATVPW